MKVTVKYSITIEKEVELTPEQYCKARADYEASGLFPKESFWQSINLDEKAAQELDHFLSSL